MVLNRKKITQIGNYEKFSSFVRYVTDMDIAWNQICSWEVVAELLGALPSLKLLNLSYNPLENIEANDLPPIPLAPKLRILVLNRVKIGAETLKAILLQMPNLKELYLSDNRFDEDKDLLDLDIPVHHNTYQPISLNVEVRQFLEFTIEIDKV